MNIDPIKIRNFHQTCLNPPSKDEFNLAIKNSITHIAPGFSGLYNNMIQSLPTAVKDLFYDEFVIMWGNPLTDGMKVPEEWKVQYFNPIPKVGQEPTRANIRPLMLVETMHKLWTIIIRRINKFLQSNILYHAYNGCFPERSTDTASMI